MPRIPEGASLPSLIERGLDASPEPLPHSRLALEVRDLLREDLTSARAELLDALGGTLAQHVAKAEDATRHATRDELAGFTEQVRRAVRDEIQRAAGMG